MKDYVKSLRLLHARQTQTRRLDDLWREGRRRRRYSISLRYRWFRRWRRKGASNRRWGFSAQRWGFSCGKDPHLACNNPCLGKNWKTRLLYIFLVESLETSVLRTFRFRCGSDPHLVMLLRFLQFTRVFRKSSLCCEENLTLVGLGPNVTCDCKELDEQFRTLLLEDVADLNDAWHPRSWPAAAHDGSQRFENVPWCSLSSRTMTNTSDLSRLLCFIQHQIR